MKKVIQINGMKCEHCVARVKDALSSLSSIKKVKVNLEKKVAVIQGDVDDAILKDIVTKAGYEVVSILEK